MNIRNYQPGDDATQAAIYNEAAGQLPKFKPANEGEVNRRTKVPDFDPGSRFYAIDGGEVIGYAMFHPNGRASFPWCRKGHENAADSLFEAVENAMKARGMRLAFAAYRGDWAPPKEVFKGHGVRQQVDPAMPCFRLGAFGTEGMQTKRINGLFSFLCASDRDVNPLALDLMHHATVRLEESDAGSLAAQVPSDAPHLLQFYQRYFRRQASFPVFEKAL